MSTAYSMAMSGFGVPVWYGCKKDVGVDLFGRPVAGVEPIEIMANPTVNGAEKVPDQSEELRVRTVVHVNSSGGHITRGIDMAGLVVSEMARFLGEIRSVLGAQSIWTGRHSDNNARPTSRFANVADRWPHVWKPS